MSDIEFEGVVELASSSRAKTVPGWDLTPDVLAHCLVEKNSPAKAMDLACARYADAVNSIAEFKCWLAVIGCVGDLLREDGRFELDDLIDAAGPVPEFGGRDGPAVTVTRH